MWVGVDQCASADRDLEGAARGSWCKDHGPSLGRLGNRWSSSCSVGFTFLSGRPSQICVRAVLCSRVRLGLDLEGGFDGPECVRRRLSPVYRLHCRRSALCLHPCATHFSDRSQSCAWSAAVRSDRSFRGLAERNCFTALLDCRDGGSAGRGLRSSARIFKEYSSAGTNFLWRSASNGDYGWRLAYAYAL